MIRRGTTDDVVAAVQVMVLARQQQSDIPAMVHSETAAMTYFQQYLQTVPFFVLSSHQRIVGMMVINNSWIEQLYVHPEHCSHGYGGQLVRYAQQLYPQRLQLWTFAANNGARRFYEYHGFIPKQMSSDNEEQTPAVRYLWSAT